jgi:hypothetical protein
MSWAVRHKMFSGRMFSERGNYKHNQQKGGFHTHVCTPSLLRPRAVHLRVKRQHSGVGRGGIADGRLSKRDGRMAVRGGGGNRGAK